MSEVTVFCSRFYGFLGMYKVSVKKFWGVKMVSQDGESRGFVVLTPPRLVVLKGLRLAEIHNSGKPCLGGCRSMPASMSLAGVEGFGPEFITVSNFK
jgi:hypothetical protein